MNADSKADQEDPRRGRMQIRPNPRSFEIRIKEKSVKDSPTTHFTKVEAAQDSQTQLQLEEKNTIPAWLKRDILPRGPAVRIVAKPLELPSCCPICTKHGHWPNQCPWKKQVPIGVTQVGKGYVVDGRRVIRLKCAYCHETGNKLFKETGGDVPLHPCWFDTSPDD